jgi:DNA-binding MarR family transcriptional regulator
MLLTDVLRLLRADFYRRAPGIPLTPQLHRLLMLIHRNPRCRQVELAEWLELAPVTVGRMLDRLEKQQFVRRDGHPDDRRAVCVELEPGALPLVQRLAGIAAETRERALAGLDVRDRAALIDALARVRENLQQEPTGHARKDGPHGR